MFGRHGVSDSTIQNVCNNPCTMHVFRSLIIFYILAYFTCTNMGSLAKTLVARLDINTLIELCEYLLF